MLEVRDLSYSISGKIILDSLMFRVQPGEICSVVGKSGSGKSSLLTLLSGKIATYSGAIHAAGKLCTSRYLRSYTTLFPSTDFSGQNDSVRSKIVSVRTPLKKMFQPLTPIDWETADDYISAMSLLSCASKDPETLPDALYKKVLLACAMTRDKPLLLLDNPTEGLDPAGIFDLEHSLKRYTMNGNIIICATHDLNFASRVSDSIIMLRKGEIFLQGGHDIITEENIRETLGLDSIVNKSVYNGKPEVSYIPQM